MTRAVRFDRYGDRDVLYLTDVTPPEPGPGEVLLTVRASSVNPFDTQLRLGVLQDLFPATFPASQGSDVAGVVLEVGPGTASPLAPGDEVLGWTLQAGHATEIVVPADQLVVKPADLSWEQAGSLATVGFAAQAAIAAVEPTPGETVAVSAATGGVGTIVVQLLARLGATVLAISGEEGAERLRRYGAIPVAYGAGLRSRLIEAAGPHGIDAFIDLYGPEYLDVAVDLGVKADRIETTIAIERAIQIGAKFDGRHNAASRAVLEPLARLVASGAVDLPIVATYPLDGVMAAFEHLEAGHTHGKIVLVP